MNAIQALTALFIFSSLLAPITASAQSQACHATGPTEAASKQARLATGYGKYHMPITTKSPEAQAFFDQGIALLHSFWMYEADRSFQRAAELDPECAMAQWGIAQASVNEERRDAAINKAKSLARNATERERLYIEAVESRYTGSVRKVQNNGFLGSSDPYRQVLHRLVTAYPDDLEAKLFLALAVMAGYGQDGSPNPGTTEAIALCREVLAKQPEHAGAHHYLIHAVEASKHPQDGVPSADVYGKLVPMIPHAVHMPGHIYVHVNRWEDAAKAFEVSAARDRDYMAAEHETSDHSSGPYSHNLHFLTTVYGYQGRYRDGVRASQELLDVAARPDEQTSRTALEGRMAMLRMLVRFERWDEILDGKSLPDEGGFQVFKRWRQFALALAQLGKGQIDAARSGLSALEKGIKNLDKELSKQKDPPQRGQQDRQARALKVAALELKGKILIADGKADKGVGVLGKALDQERDLGYAEPPLYLHPMEEVVGNSLLGLKRWARAEEMFHAALERDPGSGFALFGLMQAYAAEGKDTEARATYAQFMDAWKGADSDLAQLRQAREIVAGNSRPAGR
jgi:tetratricopeptide (TPR) repeat protein